MSDVVFRARDLERATLERRLSTWRFEAWQTFRDIIHDPGFPCFFAPTADKKETLRFVFLDETDASNVADLQAGLKVYLDEVREVERRSVAEAAYLLLIVFVRNPPGTELDDEHRTGWKLINQLHRHDPAAWPDHVEPDPQSPAWSFCWDGVPLFVNISAAGHQRRRSRHLGRHLTLVIQPRDAFDTIAGDNPKGRALREQIRDRIEPYDGQPASPLLGTYGRPECLEWVQYALPEDNGLSSSPALSGCPFHRSQEDEEQDGSVFREEDLVGV